MRALPLLYALLAATAGPAHAQDADALNLADKADMKAEKPSDWKVFGEVGLRESMRRSNGETLHAGRAVARRAL